MLIFCYVFVKSLMQFLVYENFALVETLTELFFAVFADEFTLKLCKIIV
jgi:hypothetical protein